MSMLYTFMWRSENLIWTIPIPFCVTLQLRQHLRHYQMKSFYVDHIFIHTMLSILLFTVLRLDHLKSQTTEGGTTANLLYCIKMWLFSNDNVSYEEDATKLTVTYTTTVFTFLGTLWANGSKIFFPEKCWATKYS